MMQAIHPDPFEIISTFSQIHNYWMVKERDLFNEKLNGLIGELEEIEKERIEKAPATPRPVSENVATASGEKEALLQQAEAAGVEPVERPDAGDQVLHGAHLNDAVDVIDIMA